MNVEDDNTEEEGLKDCYGGKNFHIPLEVIKYSL